MKWPWLIFGIALLLLGLFYFMNSGVGSLQAIGAVILVFIGIAMFVRGGRKRRVR